MVVRQKLASAYKQVIGTLEYALKGIHYQKDELLVLCMHSTPGVWMKEFGQIFTFLKKHFTVLSAKDLERYYQGILTDGPYVLFTFDDGLKNNRNAAEYLARQGVSAYFFIVPDFAEATDSKKYYLRYVRPVTDPSFDREAEDFQSLTYPELTELIQLGHCIGSHSATHTMHLSMSDTELHGEIAVSKQRLSAQLDVPVNAFCSTNKTSQSISAKAKRLISEQYDYHFTTFPGLNGPLKNRQLIFRRNIEVNWPMGKIKYALGQMDLPRWKSPIDQFHLLG